MMAFGTEEEEEVERIIVRCYEHSERIVTNIEASFHNTLFSMTAFPFRCMLTLQLKDVF